jgi:4-hydroxy 2-oxovalerate aldolase
MKNIRVLDCTLRDGGRIIDCAFPDSKISQIAENLSLAGVDIVELGFLRDSRTVDYSGNSTFFTDVAQITPFIPQGNYKTEYVAFIDFSMFDFSMLKARTKGSISGIRVGFTRNDYEQHCSDLLNAFRTVKVLGYNLFIQGVNTLEYADLDLLQLIETINVIQPVSFGIVDTYGGMYVDDVARLYGLIDHNLDSGIAIDFHSHNNFQLSFSFAQEVIRLSNGVRKIIVDATLDGMGKGAGNLNTELIIDFLVRKMNYGYNTDLIFDTIDDHLHDLREKLHWGYSPTALLSGIYHSHPNNVIYLTQKFRLNTKDIKNILSMLEAPERQRYDYDRLDHLLEEYGNANRDDAASLATLSETFAGSSVLVLAPGMTILTHRESIDRYIAKHAPIIIGVNFTPDYPDSYSFFANKKRFAARKISDISKVIVSSNVEHALADAITVNYHSLVNRGHKLFDNSALMLLNLLKRLRVAEIAIAGMDGFVSGSHNNYFDASLEVERLHTQFDAINAELSTMLGRYAAAVKGQCTVSLITPSKFDTVLKLKQS